MYLPAAVSAISAPASWLVSFACFGRYSSQRKFNELKMYTSDACEPRGHYVRSLCPPVVLQPTTRNVPVDSVPPVHKSRTLEDWKQVYFSTWSGGKGKKLLNAIWLVPAMLQHQRTSIHEPGRTVNRPVRYSFQAPWYLICHRIGMGCLYQL